MMYPDYDLFTLVHRDLPFSETHALFSSNTPDFDLSLGSGSSLEEEGHDDSAALVSIFLVY